MPTLFDDLPSGDGLPRPSREIAEGVVHLPGWLDARLQRELVHTARDVARTVAGTPLAMRRPHVRGGQMSVHLLALGRFWQTNPYRYVTHVAGHAVPELPGLFIDLAARALHDAGSLSESLRPWVQNYRAQAGLVNFYPPGASMGMHQDANELSEAPVISMSIGDSAIFRLGGVLNRNRPWTDVPLLSGDVIIFGGAHRRAFHGVPRVDEGTAPADCGLTEGRINITIRQVDL